MSYHEEIPQHFVVDDELWQALGKADAQAVCCHCGITYDERKGSYCVPVLDEVYEVFSREKKIVERENGRPPDERYRVELTLFLLHYLLGMKAVSKSDKRVSEKELKGGEMFFRGPHALPTQGIVRKFGAHVQGLVDRGAALGGRKVPFGDAAVELAPAPNVSVTYVLWEADEEFPAAASILFDPAIQQILPLDVIYGVCIFTAHRLVEES